MNNVLASSLILAFASVISSPSSAQTITIEVASAPSIYQETFEAVVAAFEAAHPEINVNLIPAVREDEELVQRTLRSAIVGNLPDVLFVSPNLMRPLIDRELAVPLETLGATATQRNSLGLVRGAEGVGKVDGVLYGMPLGVSTPVIAYNADLVEQAGGDPERFPTTWPETISLIQRIHKVENRSIGGFFEYDNTGNWTYKALLATLGGQMMLPGDGGIAFDSPEGLEAFHILKSFGEAGQGSIDMTRDQARQAFAAGTVGILVTSSGALPGLERQVADAFPVRAAPLPLASADGGVPAAGMVAMVLAQQAAERVAAWEFIKYVVGTEAQTIIGKTTGLVSVNQQALDDPELLGSQILDRPNQQAAITQLSRLTEWYAFPGENSIKITDVIIQYLQAVLTLKQSPEDALQAMKLDVQALLDEQRLQ
ncbi:hypothetical protein VP03_26950 [Sinorhizobium meliloti]|uniref:ABC transporter substrate-binding protein n=1 Tax=Rhizobium meliloti TaxID=382 RepID=UPI0006148CC3|nr:ABC transporter substrate-binding protein [Sinorhizobium meliloti]KKA10863.1 hypothetical protein VP03_26950 [Sinorhizobium meliloti]